MNDLQRELIQDAAAMLDGMALELRLAHALPPAYEIIPDPEVAIEHLTIKRIVKQLYDMAEPSSTSSNVSDTQAVSGANNHGSSASDSLLLTPPAEGAVVVEQPGSHSPARSDVNEHQPDPTRNAHPAVWPLVITDMAARDKLGRQRYGTPLQPFNGRDALIDAYQEALDLTVYLRQAIYERDGK